MTVARVSQVPVEVLRTNDGAVASVSQVAVEVLRIYNDTRVRTSQLALEVLRPNVDPVAASNAHPVVFICT